MLSRLCNSSLRFVPLKQIANHTHGYLAPVSSRLLEKSNYTTASDGNITETEKLLAKEETTSNNDNYEMTIENYTTAGNLENALNVLKHASISNESFKLNCTVIAELVKMMIEENYPFAEIETILSANSPSEPESNFPLFKNLLVRLTTTGEVQLLKQLFDALVKYNYIKATAGSAGNFIKASLQNGAYAQAVDLYEYMDKTYRLDCMTMALFSQFVQQKKDDLLERVYKIHEQRCGAHSALCSLGFAYSQHGYDRKARTFLEKINDDFSKDIFYECQKYVKLAQLHKARNLLTTTKGLNCKRDVIYEAYLDICIKENKAQEALELWHEYTNDDIIPTRRFKKKFVALLNAKSMEIPLDINYDKKKSDCYATTNDENRTEIIIEDDSSAGNLENPLDMSKEVKNASLKLDCFKVAELVISMVEGKYPFEEVEAILSAHSPNKPESHFSLFKSLMGRLVMAGEVQLIKQLFDALIKYNYIETTVESSGYLVNGLMKKGAYAQALDVFEHMGKTYQLTPMSKVLFIELIQHNETDLLKRGFIICEQISGTQNAFCRLGFAFVECGNVQKAKRIFERVNVNSKDVILECKRYVRHGHLEKARTLLTATKELNCNRDVIYEAILDICINQNKTQEALNLWREYTNDEKLQSRTFKKKIVTLLKANRVEIPLDLNFSNEKEKN